MTNVEKAVDHNALLLQIMAHDLLAPLTAIKWQLELLARPDVSKEKHTEYVRHLQESAELGIMLTKHAHVAGRVLVGSYASDNASLSLSACIESSLRALASQFERHGVALDIACEQESFNRDFDKELVGLLTWALAKFFLSCSPAQSSVSVRGLCVPAETVSGYAVMYTAPNIPENATCADTFTSDAATGSYDQMFVFARLVRDVAALIGVTVSMRAEGAGLIAEVSYVGPASVKEG